MATQWVICNPHRTPPNTKLPSHPIFDTWKRYVADDIVPGDGDYEYFVEEAFRLHSAVSSFGEENIWLWHLVGDKTGQAQNLATQKWIDVEELLASGAQRYGALPGAAHSGWMYSPVDDYCVLETFKKNAGRITGVGGFNDRSDDTSSMEDTLIHIKEAEGTKALLKRRHAKLPLLPVSLESWETGKSVMSALDPEAGWGLINDEGVKDAYLVQEVIPMAYEYRFFVIDGVLVTGAGCVEEFTPLDNEGEDFDFRMREDRSYECPSPIEARPDILRRYIAFAKRVVGEMSAECPELDRYVLDVALGKNDEPVIVEFNSESNAGFFACRPIRVTNALAKAVSQS
jgi:hypothetical protein